MTTHQLSQCQVNTAFFRRIITLFTLTLTFSFPAWSQTGPLPEAIEAYDEADFDKAIELFSEIAGSTASDVGSRVQAYQYLARLYVAKRMEAEARSSIRDLLNLEPPLAEFDANAERLDLMNIYYDVRKEKTGGYEVERANDRIQTIAIVDFTNGSIGSDPAQYELLSAHLASKMINFLNGSVDLKVVERERLKFILDELKLQKDGNLVDQQTAVRVGKLLGAQSVLFGNFSVIGKRIDIGVRMVKIETSEVLLGDDVNGRLNDVFDLTKELSLKIAHAINVTLDENVIEEMGESRNLDAMMSYQAGVQLLEQDQIAAAYNKFQEALTYDPSYAQAALRVTSLKHSLN